MAHEISEVLGRPEVFTAGRPPWHGLGVTVPDNVTAAQALELAHLDWQVEEAPMHMKLGDEFLAVPGKKVTYRRGITDQIVYLGTVGSEYAVIQNRDAFSFLDELADQQAVFESAGAVFSGRRVWALARFRDDMLVGGADRIKRYLLFMNAHDGSMKCRMFFTPVRVVCNNTLSLALGNRADREGIEIRHTGNVRAKVDEAIRVLGIARQTYEEAAVQYEFLLRTPMPLDDAIEYFTRVVPDNQDAKKNTRTENMRERIVENFREGRGAEVASETAWGGYNAVAEYYDHTVYELGNRKQGDRRFNSVLYGHGARMKEKAFKEALKFARAAS